MTKNIGIKEILSLIKIIYIVNLKVLFFKFTKEYRLIMSIQKFLVKEGYNIIDYSLNKGEEIVYNSAIPFEQDNDISLGIIFSLKDNKFYYQNIYSYKKGPLLDKLNRKYGINYLLNV